MKIYPKLEKFLNNLAYCAILEEHLADVCAAAGVDWANPKTFAGDVVLEFLESREKLGRERALAKMRSAIGMLEAQVENLSSLPTDIESMRVEYRELLKVQRALDFANLVLRDPEGYERYSALLDTTEAKRAVASTDFDGLVQNYELALAEIRDGKGQIAIPGFERISQLIGGFNPGRITFILADSGFGKSNLALNLAFAALSRMAVGYVNLELSYQDIAKRIAVLRSNKTWRDLYEGRIDVGDMNEKPKHQVRITDGSELHIEPIIAWARAFKREDENFGLLVLDYDQKIILDTNRETPEWRAMQIAVRRLEDEAKKNNYHVILVAQLNRDGQISSSHRAVYTAHSVLTFREYQGRPVVENSIKHRHARGPCGVSVQYDEKSCVVREMPEGVFSLRDEKQIAQESKEGKIKEASNKFANLIRGQR